MFGWDALKSSIAISASSVECPVKGCDQTVRRQRKTFQLLDAFRCPKHRIFISPSTFEYEDERENMLWASDDDLALWRCIKAPGVKRECRLARDNSEDGVTWNVFRYLEKSGLVGQFVNSVFGEKVAANPRIIYWSFCQRSRATWRPLLDASQTFGEVTYRRSEPDLAFDDERLLVFVENKFLSGNRTKPSKPDDPKRYPTGGDGWYEKVFAPGSDFQTVAVASKLYELMRLWLLGTWIAGQAGKRFALVNIVRTNAKSERDIEARFGRHLQLVPERQFVRMTWERLHAEFVRPRRSDPDADRVALYLSNKAIGYRLADRGGRGILRLAFDLSKIIQGS